MRKVKKFYVYRKFILDLHDIGVYYCAMTTNSSQTPPTRAEGRPATQFCRVVRVFRAADCVRAERPCQHAVKSMKVKPIYEY